jgi:hypothetical protein
MKPLRLERSKGMFYADMMAGSLLKLFMIGAAALLVTIYGCAGTGAFDDDAAVPAADDSEGVVPLN